MNISDFKDEGKKIFTNPRITTKNETKTEGVKDQTAVKYICNTSNMSLALSGAGIDKRPPGVTAQFPKTTNLGRG